MLFRSSELTKLRNRIKGTNPLEVLSNVAKIAPALKREAEAQIKGAEGRNQSTGRSQSNVDQAAPAGFSQSQSSFDEEEDMDLDL